MHFKKFLIEGSGDRTVNTSLSESGRLPKGASVIFSKYHRSVTKSGILRFLNLLGVWMFKVANLQLLVHQDIKLLNLEAKKERNIPRVLKVYNTRYMYVE